MIETFFFYVFSTVLILSALMVITARNPVHAVLFLILAFFNAAGLFVMLGAEFIAMTLVIVYVGAVAVLFLFVVMMLNIDFSELRKGMSKHTPVGALVGLVLLVEMGGVFIVQGPLGTASLHTLNPTPQQGLVSNTEALGLLLYTNYAYQFQVAGLILLVAMIGAITLTLRDRGDVKRQKVETQVTRNPKDVLKVEKIASGSGVS